MLFSRILTRDKLKTWPLQGTPSVERVVVAFGRWPVHPAKVTAMTMISRLRTHLESIAPIRLAEDWDNVGLLVGDPQRTVERVMTCLSMTPLSVHEAIECRAELVVTHHPLPFRPLQRLTTESTSGRMLWDLAGAGVSVYSPHTAWDSARTGINQQLAIGLGLSDIQPLQLKVDDPDSLGSGRCGIWSHALTLSAAIERVKLFLSLARVQYVGHADQMIQRVAVGCGSAGTFLETARRADCQLLVTGETTFHTCLEAAACGVALILPGHYASERFALETMAAELRAEFPELEIWASKCESDPLSWG
jgi:dinuclear metal center YbgI/SA1388 family protein